jgi:hypothetical protein
LIKLWQLKISKPFKIKTSNVKKNLSHYHYILLTIYYSVFILDLKKIIIMKYFYKRSQIEKTFLVCTMQTFFLAGAFAQTNQQNTTGKKYNDLNAQFFLGVNYVPKAGNDDTYMRKGYVLNAGIIKPFYTEGSDEFTRTFSFTAVVAFGQNEADGARKDIIDQRVPYAFAVPNFLTPVYSSEIKKATIFNIGAGIREDLFFKNISFGIGLLAGYENITRPAFILADDKLIAASNNQKIVYATSQKQKATGLFFKPSLDVTYWVDKRLGIYANTDYTFGTRFKEGNQITWNATNLDGDAYFSGNEVINGYSSARAFDKSINRLSLGIGIKYALGK